MVKRIGFPLSLNVLKPVSQHIHTQKVVNRVNIALTARRVGRSFNQCIMEKKNNSFSSIVRAVVRKIPMGTTLSYKEVGRRAGNERAARAVARIMSQNFDLSVPCHRVIRADGSLGGYNRGGTEAKRKILIREEVIL